MPEKYHIATSPVSPRRPRIGKFGVVDWREDCARCHNCVKKACVYDRYRQEMDYIRGLRQDLSALFFDCMGCFSCVQECTKALLRLSINPEYQKLGNRYWTPDILLTTWNQAETAKIPVSGAGYRGRFSGPGFDSMWLDMSEIVRPTRDGIHGREYISTAVDIGGKFAHLDVEKKQDAAKIPTLLNIPLPLLIDLMPADYPVPQLEPALMKVAQRTGTLALIDARKWPDLKKTAKGNLKNIAFYLGSGVSPVAPEILAKTRLVEIADGPDVQPRIEQLKKAHPRLIVAVRVPLDAYGVERALELGKTAVEVIHVVADDKGDEIGVAQPRFLKDMIRQIHTGLVKNGRRDEVTLIAGGGIALAEHMAKAVICGADVVSISLPLLVALECRLCPSCGNNSGCPAQLETLPQDYAVGRMTNLLSAWHGQLIEVMGAMGMREVRRLRGEAGRAMFFEDLEDQTFGKLFGRRKRA